MARRGSRGAKERRTGEFNDERLTPSNGAGLENTPTTVLRADCAIIERQRRAWNSRRRDHGGIACFHCWNVLGRVAFIPPSRLPRSTQGRREEEGEHGARGTAGKNIKRRMEFTGNRANSSSDFSRDRSAAGTSDARRGRGNSRLKYRCGSARS